MAFGQVRVLEYLERTGGKVRGRIVTDAKNRIYHQDYVWSVSGDSVLVSRADGHGDTVSIPAIIELDQSDLAFFGLYSGDGAKGSEDSRNPGRIVPAISFSQREPNLVRFAVDQFRRIFPGNIRFTFSLGEDSAFFMAGEGRDVLAAHYAAQGVAQIPAAGDLAAVRPRLNDADVRYLSERRIDVDGTSEEHLAFYYRHKAAMEQILASVKAEAVAAAGIELGPEDKVVASLRRPFKKGARQPGGSSRSDEIHVGGLNGLGELFLKMMHEIEDSLLNDEQTSASGLVEWNGRPSDLGDVLDVATFFESNPYGVIAGERPLEMRVEEDGLCGKWPRSTEVSLKKSLRLDPLWCYTSGLYLAEGTTDKATLFAMFTERPQKMALSFTSSEGASIELVLRTLLSLFSEDECVGSWKIKVGSQYFPELVVSGLKHGVPMLRGGRSGDGKLRTMEISIALREWALGVADEPLDQPSLLRSLYGERFTHVEPTGAGVARIDFASSSALCRWYFPVLMFCVFGRAIPDPAKGFYS